MTLPANIRVNTPVPFPALVTGSGPVTVAKVNGVWTLGFSVSSFGIQNPPPLANWATDYALVYDSAAKQFIQVPLGSILWAAGRIRFVAKQVNFNVGNTDTQIPIVLPPGITRYQVEAVYINLCTNAPLTTATCGLFSAAGAGGIAIIPAGTAITVTQTGGNTANNSQKITLGANAAITAFDVAVLYFRVGTPQGGAAVADVVVEIAPLS